MIGNFSDHGMEQIICPRAGLEVGEGDHEP
jgi:hypothetical protein